MEKLPFEQLEAWMPRLSGTAFKILTIVLRTLESRQIDEIRFGYGDLAKLTGASRNTVIAAVEQLEAFELVALREDGGKFFYRRGAKIEPVQNLHPSKNRTRPKIAPLDLAERIFFQWKNLFRPGVEEIFTDARRRLLDRTLGEIKAEQGTVSYRYVLQSLRGYYREFWLSSVPTSFENIFESKKTISKGSILYISWRTREK